jgi:hypothetical protein
MDLLPLTWYIESPIDFEYKQYVLFAYLQKVDISFHQEKKLSPHLLHMERMIDELVEFEACFENIKKGFQKNRYVYFDNVKLEGEDNQIIYEVRDLVEFAIPQIEPRVRVGYRILKRCNQVLF